MMVSAGCDFEVFLALGWVKILPQDISLVKRQVLVFETLLVCLNYDRPLNLFQPLLTCIGFWGLHQSLAFGQ